MVDIYADNDLYATWHRIIGTASEKGAVHTDGWLTLSRRDVLVITAASDWRTAVRRMEAVWEKLGWNAEWTRKRLGRDTEVAGKRRGINAEESCSGCRIQIRNLARKQGIAPRSKRDIPAEMTSPLPPCSPSYLPFLPPLPCKSAGPEQAATPPGGGNGEDEIRTEDLVEAILALWRSADLPDPAPSAELALALADAAMRHPRITDWEYLVTDRLQGQRDHRSGQSVTLEFLVAAEIRDQRRRAEYAEERWAKCWRRFYADE